ncbi:hypothetical protein [Streptomyces beihaiensis]|uniref:Gram-positive cocci surface proteins LPxTG domain-containing protein n=1 Tax=Streptomyces beihaiensis TaxID=2984495 RepID=A0ABT3U1V5_9ACTN|nr:hypothetical protein [Streptomyces beihaiensis]MCX3063304.1 hypothetical protein [Streptomyces beihaiensis]
MRRHTPRRTSRAALGLAGAAALITGLGAAAPALAADGTPLTVAITGENKVDLSLSGDNGDSTEPQIHLALKAPGEAWHGDGTVPVLHQGDFKIKIDATGLKGVAAVDMEQLGYQCHADGLTAVCEGSELYAGEEYNELGGIRLDVDDTSKVGDAGSIKVTGEGDGLTFTPLTVDVLVGGAELRDHKVSEPKDFAPGDTYAAPVGFRNQGGMAADGAVLRFHGSRGISFPDSYGNCAYKRTTDGPLLLQGTDAVCSFSGSYEAATAYALSQPLKVKTADFALNDVFHYSFSAVTPAKAKELLGADGYTRGTGPALTLTKVPGAAASDYTRYADMDLPTHGTYDLALTGASADGKAGDTVKATIGLRNDGPGWISAQRSGGEPIMFSVEAPEGATVTKSPADCRRTTLSKGVKGYLCWADTPFLEDAKVSFPFELRIDKVVKNAKGKVALPSYDDPQDPNQANNTAWIVLNGDDQNTGGTSTGGPKPSPSAGATGGTSGSSGSSGDPATPGASDASGTSGTSGSGGAAGSSGGSTGSGSGGGLAMTGAGGTLLVGGTAAAALGLGAALVVVMRRRRAA